MRERIKKASEHHVSPAPSHHAKMQKKKKSQNVQTRAYILLQKVKYPISVHIFYFIHIFVYIHPPKR